MRIKTFLGIVLIFFLSLKVKAQEGIFEFDVFKSEQDIYEIKIQLNQVTDIRALHIELIEENNVIGVYEATLNRNPNNQFFIFFNDELKEIIPSDFQLIINNSQGKVKAESQFLEIKVLNEDYRLIDTYRKEIIQ